MDTYETYYKGFSFDSYARMQKNAWLVRVVVDLIMNENDKIA